MTSNIYLEFDYEIESEEAANRNIEDFITDYGDSLTYAKGRIGVDYKLHTEFNMKSMDFVLLEMPQRLGVDVVDSFNLHLNEIAQEASDYIGVIEHMDSFRDINEIHKMDDLRRNLHLKMGQTVTDILAGHGVEIAGKNVVPFGKHMIEAWFEQIGHCENIKHERAHPRTKSFTRFVLKPF